MSPQNCLAILSPFSIGSSPRRRRSDEGRGVNGESERDTSDACSAVRLGGIILDIPAGPRRRGYAKARVEVRQLLDGRWRVYYKNQLLVETTPPVMQAPLRTLRRRY